jgi:hypothetical protein
VIRPDVEYDRQAAALESKLTQEAPDLEWRVARSLDVLMHERHDLLIKDQLWVSVRRGMWKSEMYVAGQILRPGMYNPAAHIAREMTAQFEQYADG